MTLFNVPPKHKLLGFTLVPTVVFCCFAGYAADNPGERFFNALTCFSNKFIYSGCDEAYRLNQSGNLNVPPDALDLFCHGPCLAETQQVLKCVDNIFSSFIFNNKAALPDIRGALHDGCSYTSQRGGFNGFGPFGEYIQGESAAEKLPSLISFFFSLMYHCLLSLHLLMIVNYVIVQVEIYIINVKIYRLNICARINCTILSNLWPFKQP